MRKFASIELFYNRKRMNAFEREHMILQRHFSEALWDCVGVGEGGYLLGCAVAC